LELKVKKTKVAPGPTTEGTSRGFGLPGLVRTQDPFESVGSGGATIPEDDEEAMLAAAIEASRQDANERQRPETHPSVDLLDQEPEGEASAPGDFEYWSENEDEDRMQE
jgi:hypothetical protein